MSLAQKVQEASTLFRQKQNTYMQRKFFRLRGKPCEDINVDRCKESNPHNFFFVFVCPTMIGMRGVELRNKDIFSSGVQPMNSSISDDSEDNV